MKNGKKLKLGDADVTPKDIFKKYKRLSLGMPKASPFSSIKISGSFFCALYFYCFIYYMLFLERLSFSFQFCFVCCNNWLDPSSFVLERDTLRFHCIEHFGFIPIHLRVFS